MIWHDRSGDNVALTIMNGSVYYYQATPLAYFNFHPSLLFKNSLTQLTKPKMVLTHTSLGQSTIMGVYAPLSIGSQDVEAVPNVYTKFHASTSDHSLWGERQTATIFLEDVVPDDLSLDALLPELIVWQRILSPLERLQAESYLALKYGITLSSSYYDADGK